MAQSKWYARGLNADTETLKSDVVNKQPRVIIAGFGRFGQIIGRLMYANRIKVTVLESDASQIRLLRKYGYKVFYGDVTQLDLLRSKWREKAEAIVICTDRPDEIMKTIELCQVHFPHLKLLLSSKKPS